jgi:thioredoxin 1
MASPNVKEFTDANFANEVEASSQPVLVDFWAEWCQPCRLLSPIIDQVADQFADKVKVGKVDIDSAREIAVKYNISMIPTIIIFKQGQPVKRFMGYLKAEALANALNDPALA